MYQVQNEAAGNINTVYMLNYPMVIILGLFNASIVYGCLKLPLYGNSYTREIYTSDTGVCIFLFMIFMSTDRFVYEIYWSV